MITEFKGDVINRDEYHVCHNDEIIHYVGKRNLKDVNAYITNYLNAISGFEIVLNVGQTLVLKELLRRGIENFKDLGFFVELTDDFFTVMEVRWNVNKRNTKEAIETLCAKNYLNREYIDGKVNRKSIKINNLVFPKSFMEMQAKYVLINLN